MRLLVDIGNTAIRWVCVDATHGSLPDPERYEHADNVAAALKSCWTGMPVPDEVWVSNVAGDQAAAAVTDWCRGHWSLAPHFAIARACCAGVINAYPEPQRLGVDRWLSLLACHGRYAQPVVIIDCGTAITVDVMQADGQHLGGLIVPGVRLTREALTEKTPLDVEGRQISDVSLFARDTLDAVLGGTLYMAAAFIDRILADVAEALGKVPKGIISGGSAEDLLPLLKNGFEHRPALVLEGLAIHAEACV